MALNTIAVTSTVERSFCRRMSRCWGGSRSGTIYTIIDVVHRPARTARDIVHFSVSLHAAQVTNAVGVGVTIASATSKGSLLTQKDQFVEVAGRIQAIIGIIMGLSFASRHGIETASLVAYQA